MAKRQRGGARPGQRAPQQRSTQPAPKPATPPSPAGSLSDDDLARAAELEAQIVADERAATASVNRGRDSRRAETVGPAARGRSAGGLTAVAEDEYRYVMRDLRRIAVVFTGIFSALLVSWLLIVVLAVVKV